MQLPVKFNYTHKQFQNSEWFIDENTHEYKPSFDEVMVRTTRKLLLKYAPNFCIRVGLTEDTPVLGSGVHSVAFLTHKTRVLKITTSLADAKTSKYLSQYGKIPHLVQVYNTCTLNLNNQIFYGIRSERLFWKVKDYERQGINTNAVFPSYAFEQYIEKLGKALGIEGMDYDLHWNNIAIDRYNRLTAFDFGFTTPGNRVTMPESWKE